MPHQSRVNFFSLLFSVSLLLNGCASGDAKVFYEISTSKYFSSAEVRDEFILRVSGDSFVEGTFSFTINQENGKVLFHEEYPTRALLDYGYNGDKDDPAQMEAYMRNRLNSFFQDKHFREPAIGAEEEYDEDYSTREVWDSIAADREAVGFYYLIGEEAGCWIAYNKAADKVDKYFCCC